MKKIAIITMISALAFSASAIEMKTDDEKISYIIGTQMAESLTQGEVDKAIKVDEKILFEGLSVILAGKEPQIKKEEMDKVMKVFAERMMKVAEEQEAKVKEKMKELAKANEAEAKKLLEDNKAKEGVKVTKSGLQYRIIKEGKGAKPTVKDTVKVHYEGTLASGEKFDSSYDRKEPAEFPLSAVIDGWIEGLQLMSTGSTFEFFIPAALAYGETGPEQIGPNRALIFKVELLEIKPAAEVEKASEVKEGEAKEGEAKKEEAKKEEVKK